MMGKEKIGKKVWLLDGSLQSGFTLKSKKTFTLKEVKDGREFNDWAEHYTIVDDESGQEISVREFNVIFAPENEDDLGRYLRLNECYADEVYDNNIGLKCVSISWGDWKHEHLWCKNLMEYLGYKEIGSKVTEEDGSDCYSAIHYFMKTA